jgi:hypothetical protein
MLYHGPVGLPQDAVRGPAIMRCKLSPNSRFQSKATDIAVRIE